MRVLVLDGNENQAVACVRSLAKAGHTVTVGAPTNWSKAGWSRDCARSFQYPSPDVDVEGFIFCIVEESRREPGTLVLPMTERTTLPLSKERERVFAVNGRLVLPPHSTVLRAFDKRETTALASVIGITVPRTVVVSNRSELESATKTIGFPIVLKPCSSEEVTSAGTVRPTGAPLYARTFNECAAAYENMRLHCGTIMVQEFINGQGEGYFALMRQGEPRAEFAHRRIRDVRPTGSGSAVRISTSPDDSLRDQAVKMLRELRWHGVAMVEFRRKANGSLVFLEVNGRFWNSLPLAVYAGADFPCQLVELAEKGDVAPSPPYRVGVRCRWLLGDFRHLSEVWRGAPPSYPGKYPGRWQALFDFLVPVRGTFHDNFTLRDPLPELGDWLDFLFRRSFSYLKRHPIPNRGVHA